MHDLKYIRENPEAFDAALARRGASPVAAQIVELDEQRRAVLTQVQDALARRNEASKAIGAAMGKGRGKEVIAVVRGADIIIILVDVFNERHFDVT